MDHEPNAVRVQSPFGRPRQPAILVAALAVFLLIALVKPWSFGEDGADTGRPGNRGALPSPSALAIDVEPSPTPAPSIFDPNAMPCLTDATEQVVVIERWAGHEVRSWIAVADVTVSGPLDGRLVPIPIFSSHVIGLGICAPRTLVGTQQPAARLLDVEAIVQAADGPFAVDLGEPGAITGHPGGSEPAILYGAPKVAVPKASVGPPRSGPPASRTVLEPAPATPTSGSGLPSPSDDWATWPTGSYAIAFLFPSDEPNVVRWLRIDVIGRAGAAD